MSTIDDRRAGMPESLADWASRNGIAGRQWLVVGKGPSCARIGQFDLRDFSILTLNHAVREVEADIAHAIDLDVLETLDARAVDRARHWLLPWYPHVRNRPGPTDLGELATQHPVVSRLNREGRLLWYNAATAPSHRDGQAVVPVRFFSAEAAINALVLNGVRRIRTLGVDGGGSYAPAFDDVSDSTLLANGRTSFDRQFESIADTVFRYDVDFGPLDGEVPVRVYVATERAQMLATRVLEYSIRRRSSITAVVHPLCDFPIEVPEPRDLLNRPRTPFSFQRFLIPEAAGLRGRAIYLDSDMQVFTDIRALWLQPMGDAPLLSVAAGGGDGRRPQFSVMLLDCERLGWRIAEIVARLDDGSLDYDGLMYEMKVAAGWRAEIAPRWNCLERFDADTALLHYTDMQMQPWISTRNPLAYLWVGELRHAIGAGYISPDYVAGEVAQGFARPSLAWQLEHDVDDPLLLPKAARALDRDYQPPYMALATRGIGSPWVSAGSRVRALARHLYRRIGLADVAARVRNRVDR